jgi:hypothetical protein
MNAEIDYDLTPDQWETLKALRLPAPKCRVLNPSIVENLIALQLAAMTDGHAAMTDGHAAMTDGHPAITPKGRRVLLRGSPRLWDVAA